MFPVRYDGAVARASTARTSPAAPAAPVPSLPEGRPLRKDAQRTRRLVLDAAGELFARRGLDVGFDEIARLAGVGVGTVYRRFPDRDSLVEALFSEKADEIVADASAALAVSDPWEAIVDFCERTIVKRNRDRGLAEVLANGEHGHERLEALRERMGAILDELLGRGHRAGVVRAEIETVDLALMTYVLSRFTVDGEPEIWRRYLALLLNAIRTPPVPDPRPHPHPHPDPDPLPGPAPTLRMFQEIARRL